MKSCSMITYVKTDMIFGRVAADVMVIEFQKRGLMHADINFILDEASKTLLGSHYKLMRYISAEIPDNNKSVLKDAVIKHMIHRTCKDNSRSACMKSGSFSKRVPNLFREETRSSKMCKYMIHKNKEGCRKCRY